MTEQTNPLLAQAKASEADHTKGENHEDFIAPAGLTMARFTGYVEVGKRPQKPWQGKPKPDASEARFTFECLSPKNIREIEVEGEKITTTDVIGCKVTMKTGDKASFVKLLNRMAYGREGITNFAQMLGEAFLINVIHAEGKDRDGKDKTYANMKDAEFNWTISAPVQTDALTGQTTLLPVPEATIDLRLLLWDNPTPEQWASVFIDGEREVKDDKGNVTMESKNWLQRDIVTSALNFAGSPLEQMLNGVGDLDLPGDVADGPVDATDETQVAQPTAEDLAALAKLSAAQENAAKALVASAAAQAAQTEAKTEPETAPLDEAAQLAQAQAIIKKLMEGK